MVRGAQSCVLTEVYVDCVRTRDSINLSASGRRLNLQVLGYVLVS